jgi:hypothetical protein
VIAGLVIGTWVFGGGRSGKSAGVQYAGMGTGCNMADVPQEALDTLDESDAVPTAADEGLDSLAALTSRRGNGPPPASGKCGAGQTKCKGLCVNTQSDFYNCGACGVQCAAGQVCSNGVCGCPVGQTDCNGACTDLLSNSANCGACGVQCPSGHVCSGGVCECPYGQADCNGACTDLTTDTNCGTCGNACAQGTTCISGACVVPPPCYPYTECSGQCADLQWDNSNCGSCGNACGSGFTCISGSCVDQSCYYPFADCGNGCTYLYDASNCGSCGNVCLGGEYCEAGYCRLPG